MKRNPYMDAENLFRYAEEKGVERNEKAEEAVKAWVEVVNQAYNAGYADGAKDAREEG